MVEEEIKNLREKLNQSIANDEKYEIIYKLSVELDELIMKFYLEKSIAWVLPGDGNCAKGIKIFKSELPVGTAECC